jgi:hypothetical protein
VRHESTWVYCSYPRLGSGEARSCPLSGRSFDMYCAHQAFAACADAEFRSLGGTPNYGPRHNLCLLKRLYFLNYRFACMTLINFLSNYFRKQIYMNVC